VGRALLATYLTLWHRIRIVGREHLPRTGGVLIVANHQSFLDIPVLAAGAPRHVAFVARATLADSRFLAFIMREAGCVLIRPNTPDRAALEGMIAHLEGGDCVAVFPEGTRTPDGALGTFRGGAAVAARRARVPIVPAAITGAFEAWPRDRSLPRPRRVHVRFGPAFAADVEEPMQQARRVIAEMMGDRSPAAG
jgi:1-acyl-sn-glycerol-3-phosphate acyltransferase